MYCISVGYFITLCVLQLFSGCSARHTSSSLYFHHYFFLIVQMRHTFFLSRCTKSNTQVSCLRNVGFSRFGAPGQNNNNSFHIWAPGSPDGVDITFWNCSHAFQVVDIRCPLCVVNAISGCCPRWLLFLEPFFNYWEGALDSIFSTGMNDQIHSIWILLFMITNFVAKQRYSHLVNVFLF